MATEAQKISKGALHRVTKPVALAVTAVANTDFTFTVPAGARDVSFGVLTTTAFGAVTDAQLQLGKTVGGAEYVAATSVKALGKVSPALVGANIADLDTVPGSVGADVTFNGRIVQSGGNSAVGAATLHVSYALPV